MGARVTDQADGLRRLLGQAPVRVVAVAGMGPGAGATTAAMSLGAALAQQGREVLLLDEHHPKLRSACDVWALGPRGTLRDVADRRLRIDQVAAGALCGVQVLPAPSGVAVDPRTLWPRGIVLVDAAFDDEGHLSPLAQGADELLLVLQPHPSAITSAYAGIKRLHRAHALKQLRFLLNGVADVATAQQVMHNLAQAASRYLALSLLPVGWVRADPWLADAARLRQTVVEAFPASAAAVDFRAIADDMGRWSWRTPARPAVFPQALAA
ncbi:MinD/ParA family ATP-binding protein [Acidovorax cavernicola]|uniref:Flagellar biosynthesis protein FlhG n=1 Tax=Acidovorax cavernicola TaxID=1675792 RepID=A0A9X8D3J3_9BURK|nr:flagellar biosynthesis protein FlhG [Acidovorax cavernicola]RIX78166.1 flagellar biosynthesis protein FlhG [Acidovorax cavernicola]